MDRKEANAITGSRIIRCAIVRGSRLSNVQGREPLMNTFYFWCSSNNKLGNTWFRWKELKLHLLQYLRGIVNRFYRDYYVISKWRSLWENVIITDQIIVIILFVMIYSWYEQQCVSILRVYETQTSGRHSTLQRLVDNFSREFLLVSIIFIKMQIYINICHVITYQMLQRI